MQARHLRVLGALLMALAIIAVGSRWLGRSHTSEKSRVPPSSSAKIEDTPSVARSDRSGSSPQGDGQRAPSEGPADPSETVQGFVLGVDNLPVAGAVVETHPGGVQLAVTESNGEFSFGYEPPGMVVHARMGRLQSAPALSSASALERSLILTLKEEALLRVRVVSSSTQEPIAGATLQLSRGGGVSSKDQEALADRRGTASFALGRGGSFHVTARADGYGTIQRRLWAAPASTGEQQLTLALPPECSARGVVRNAQGQPAAHARVTAQDTSSNQPSVSVQADARGTFHFSQLHAAVFTFEATDPKLGWGQSPLVELPSKREIVITVNAEPSLRGMVLDAQGQAVATAVVQALPQAAGAFRLPERRQAVSDALGQFEFLGLPTDRVLVGATLGGAASDTVAVDLPRLSRVELRLTESDGISGRITDVAGQPVPGAQVIAKLQGVPAARRLVTVAGPDGRFALSGVGTGKWNLFAHSPTDLVEGQDLLERVLATVEAGATGVSLVVPGAGAIEGWVELEDGSVPDNVALVLSGRALISPSGGSFLFQGIPEGTHELVVTGPGFEATRVSDVVVSANQTTSLDAIRVRGGRRVRGRVTNASHQPVGGVEIMASPLLYAAAQGLNRSSPEDEPDLRYASSDQAGAFEVRGLSNVRVGILAEHPTYGRSTIAVLEANATGPIELVLRPTANVQGTVKMAGAPLEGIAVVAKDEASIGTFTGISGKDGGYQLVRLPAGKYTVTAVNRQSGNFELRKQDIVLASGKNQSLNFDFGERGATVSVHVADQPYKPESAVLKGPSVYVQQTRTEDAYVFENVIPGEYKLCVTFAQRPEPAQMQCQPLSVSAGKTQAVQL